MKSITEAAAMNIYLLTFTEQDAYEITAVVIAETEEHAKQCFIDYFIRGDQFLAGLEVVISMIGTANSNLLSKVVCYDIPQF
jgi:uncharacterized protein (UPF0303 family)